ncbi:MAG: mechanosensitive ion channel family protein [Bacteroidota bacterium]
MFDQIDFPYLKEQFFEFIKAVGPTAIKAIVALVVGVLVIRLIKRLLKRFLRKAKIEMSLRTFIESLAIFVLYGLLFAIIGIILGIQATSFIAIFGAAGIAVGLALQGSLANFAGGVLILAFKPFRVGDLVEVNGKLGEVHQIDILYTRIQSFDGRIITMPNGNVANSDVDNRSMNPIRRIDLFLKFDFKEDLDQIREVLYASQVKHEKVLKEPEPDVRLDRIGDYEMVVTARSWINSDDYWPMYWIQLEAAKKALDEAGIALTIPKRGVYQLGEEVPAAQEKKPK